MKKIERINTVEQMATFRRCRAARGFGNHLFQVPLDSRHPDDMLYCVAVALVRLSTLAMLTSVSLSTRLARIWVPSRPLAIFRLRCRASRVSVDEPECGVRSVMGGVESWRAGRDPTGWVSTRSLW
jgi:hypothetical protein